MSEPGSQAEDFFRQGVAHERAGRMAEARAAYERTVALVPGHLQALNNLGTLLDEAGESRAAEARYRAAIAAHPKAPEPWVNLGNGLRAQGRYNDARGAFQEALARRGDLAEAHWNLALVDLAAGRFAEGWNHYRFRPTADRSRPPPTLADGTLTLVAEQGLGDQLFFLRFVPALIARGVTVGLRLDPRLTAMVGRWQDLPPVGDETLSIADVPYLLKASDCAPAILLTPLPERMTAMRALLAAAGPPPYLGVTWRAGERGQGALFKEAPIEALGKALKGVSATLIDLQRAPAEGEHKSFARGADSPVADFSPCNNDLEDMLALMSLLDDYVGVSNTNMHLRASVGRNARVLVAHPPEYRWMEEGTSPWFPGFTLYRAAAGNDWNEALTQLRADIVS